MNKSISKKKIAVALSGGIDSSVAAALLKEEGHNLIGIFMKLWAEPCLKKGLNQAEERAKKVAQILNIPFYRINLQKEFKKIIVDYFLKEVKKGVTPNPCVICNKEIKFGLLLKQALKLKADYLATGHYARKIQKTSPKGQNKRAKGETFKLLKAKDKSKDQLYFLWMLSQKQLKRTLLPIGDYKRQEVEMMAKKFKLPFSGVKKSQEICFIDKNIESFFKKYLKNKPGPIINKQGKVLESHQGLHFYTIGQRKGIKLSAGPYYVVEKFFKKNVLIVSKKENYLFKKELIVTKINWLSGQEPKFPLKTGVKIRYGAPEAGALIKKLHKSRYRIVFDRTKRAITPGQSAVFYDKEELLGGGIIL